jgi:predicted small lipoprotein YifL
VKWVLEELLQKMGNKFKILGTLLSAALLSACGQSGPLYMPGEATGVHKKDVFVLGNDQSKPQTPATQKNTQDKTKPKANTTTPPPVSDTTTTEPDYAGDEMDPWNW